MNEAELRLQNRALISKLIRGQKAVQRSTYDVTKLGRELDSLQSRLDDLTVDGRDTSAVPVISASRSNTSTITGDGNTNNNNVTNTRWSSRDLGRYNKRDGSRFQSPDISDRAPSPRRSNSKVYTLDNTLDSDDRLASPRQPKLYTLDGSSTSPSPQPRTLRQLGDFPSQQSPRQRSLYTLRDFPAEASPRQRGDFPLLVSPVLPSPKQLEQGGFSTQQSSRRQELPSVRNSPTRLSPRQRGRSPIRESTTPPSPQQPMVYTLGDSPSPDNGVMVERRSPDESKNVRRKLAEEMGSSPLTSPPIKDFLPEDSKATPKRRPLGDATNVRTPRQTNRASAFETPKSILKHRKLIDSHVEVDSRFAHTPGWMERAKHTRLRPPRDTCDAKSNKNQKKSVKPRKLPSSDKTEISDLRAVSFLSDTQTSGLNIGDPSALKTEAGNLRSSASGQRSPSPPQKSPPLIRQGEMFSDVPPSLDRNTMPTPSLLSEAQPSPDSSVSANVGRQRMMGYDWIAALLDRSGVPEVTDRHESYFRELQEFQRLNRDECQNEAVNQPAGNSLLSYIDTDDIALAVPEATSPNHTCIHSYTVDSRLYTIPVNGDRTGASRCAVCSRKKQLPSTSSPGFVRISIPRSTLSSPYRVKPHRRKSFDPSDSVALSKHCLAGWVHQRPLKLPIGRNVDLANETKRLKSRFVMTMAEAEELAKKTKMSIPPDSRALDQTTLYNREVKKITNQLLDMSHAMEFQSQLHNKTPIH